jgi:chromosomal replication initiator protein
MSTAEKIINDYQEIWKQVNQDLLLRYGEGVYRSWLSKLTLFEFDGVEITLSLPTIFMRDWVKSNYMDVIKGLWFHYLPEIKEVNLVVKSDMQQVAPVLEFTQLESSVSTTKDKANENNILSSPLDPKYSFKNFVVGRPNELAYAAAYAVAESPKVVCESNPLFLYGGVGLGKTHLMHAIANHIAEHHKTRKVIYMSAEKFMYQFVQALRNKDIMSFKEYFRSVDILMIDDIQFICGKDSTQEEFFHTFNTLIDNNRQMVISCDRSPSDLDNIEERIKSRLGWGLVADVHSTTYELRLGILQSKIEQMNAVVPMSVVEFLAAKITSNVRELEGALNKVIAHSTLVGREISLESTHNILSDLLRSNERVVTIEEIQKKVAERYNIKISDMSSARRLRAVARPRQVAMYLSKHLTTKSLADIGKKFGKKDHTTVMHALKTVDTLCKTDLEFLEEINLLKRILQS